MRSWKNRFAGYLGLRAPNQPLFRHLAKSVDPVDQIDFMADLGFAGVQDNFLVLRTPQDQERIGAAVARRGLAMGSFVFDAKNWNRPHWSGEALDGLEAALDASIAAAHRTGGTIVTCVTGLDPARSRAEQREAMAQNLRRLADRAAAAGLILCPEPTNPGFLPGMLLEDLAETLTMIDAVNHPNVALMFDVGHLALNGENIPAAITAVARHIAAVQVSDVSPALPFKKVDLGAGALDWPAIFARFRAVGYTGLIEVEHLPLEESAAGEQALIDRLRNVDERT